jgi:RNA-directed DNA polymerase
LTSTELKDRWRSFIQGWWGYFQLAEDRQSIFRLEGWIRRHIRKCFWLRWHNKKGRERKLRGLGVKGRLLQVASSVRGAWRIAAAQAMQSALTNAVLRAKGFLMPSDLAAKQQGC